MKVTVSNLIIIDEPTKEIKDYCKKELTFANPDYQKKRVMGYSLWNTPKTIKLYEIYDNKYIYQLAVLMIYSICILTLLYLRI